MAGGRIALDAMGGDHAPHVPVEAALRVIDEHQIPLALTGDEFVIRAIIGDRSVPESLLEIVDAPDVVSMEDEAVAAVRRKRRASIPVSLDLLKSGMADAVVSAGSTGAVVASAVVGLGRLAGVSRPGIAVHIPSVGGPPVLLIDAGALIDSRPEHLWQHARLASAFVTHVSGIDRPRVGLISNGEEPTKGNTLVKQTHVLLESDSELNFVGNVEGRDISSNLCDVVVTDGFTGNVILKTAEGTVQLMQESLRTEFKRRWSTAILASMLRPAFRRAGALLDYREYGGAPLLGVDGLVFIAHGSSDVHALVNAIRAAQRATQQGAMNAVRGAVDG